MPEKNVCVQTMTADALAAQNGALWDVWLDKYVKRLTADMGDVDDVTSADNVRRRVMNSTNPRSDPLVCSFIDACQFHQSTV